MVKLCYVLRAIKTFYTHPVPADMFISLQFSQLSIENSLLYINKMQ
jgi:hypothetical protein